MYRVEFTLDGGTDLDGRKMSRYFSMAQKAQTFIQQFFAVMGIDPSELRRSYDPGEYLDRISGTKVMLDVSKKQVDTDASGEPVYQNQIESISLLYLPEPASVTGSGRRRG